MSINDQYSSAESALSRAFGGMSSCCSVVCDCGRVYFVTAHGHGDFSEGELEAHKAAQQKEPGRFIECWAFDSVELVRICGKELVIQCACGTAREYLAFFESHRDQLADYLAERLKEEIGELERQINDARRRARGMDDWQRARSPGHYMGAGI